MVNPSIYSDSAFNVHEMPLFFEIYTAFVLVVQIIYWPFPPMAPPVVVVDVPFIANIVDDHVDPLYVYIVPLFVEEA